MSRKSQLRQRTHRLTREHRPKKSRQPRNNIINRSVDLGVEHLEPRWVLASPGSLDTTFDLDGVLTGDFGAAAGTDVRIQAVAVQADGKIVVAGTIDTTADPIEDIVVGRFNADGSLDTTFGDNDSIGGFTTFTFNGQQSFVNDVGIDALGNIVVVGRGVNAALTQNGFGVARLGSDGELDGSFGTAGRVVTTFAAGSPAEAWSVAFQSDGKIVVAGLEDNPNATVNRNDFAIARYNTNGTLDTTFDGDGKVTTDFFGRDDNAFDVVIQQVGLLEKILVVGDADRAGLAINDFALARYNDNGTLDSSFGTAGKVVTVTGSGALASQVSTIGAVTLDSVGRIIVAGTVGDINTTTDMIIGRYTASGVLDTTFNSAPVSGTFAGTLRVNHALIDIGFGIVAQPDGKYIIGGSAITTTTSTTASYRYGLARVGATGALDSTFGTGGLVQVPAYNDAGAPDPPFEPTEPDNLRMMDLALQPDGKLLAAGWVDLETTEPDYLLARYETGIVVQSISGPATVNEGATYTLTLSSSDPTTTSWTINWGDSTQVVSGNPSTVTHVYADGPNNYTISATVTTSTSTTPVGNTVAVAVQNVAPTLAISGAADVDEGASYTLNLSSLDPGADTITSWTINWGDTTEVVPGNPASVIHTYADGDANHTISASATDEDGTFAAANTVAVTVHNVDPTLAISGAADVDEGASYTLNLSSFDPGVDTITSWTINWGDGTEVVSGNPTSVGHTYADGDANYTISASATDEDGTFAAGNTVAVTVHNVDPTADDATFSAVENSPNGTVVGTVTAMDQGDDTLAFSIVGGTGAAAFAINSSTGEITVANSALLDFESSPTLTLQVEVSDGDGGIDTATITINLINQASISGVVFVDVNQNGLFDANEPGIDGVVIQLLDQFGNPVLDSQGDPITAVTNGGGFYLFEDLDAGTYQLFEVQPTGVNDGAEDLGSLGGTIVANDRMQLTIAQTDAYDYAFAELGQQLTAGDAATIGFWQNKHGQALITQGGTQLANWLSTTFTNIFGNTLTGATGSTVAAFYRDQLFKQTGKKNAGPAKVDAQFMAVAFATYFTSSNLAGTVATSYGFHVTDTGIGTKIVNVGTKGAAFSVANGTNRTIMQLLLATDALTDQPDSQLGFAAIYDTDGNGTISAAEATLRTMANEVFTFINESGGV